MGHTKAEVNTNVTYFLDSGPGVGLGPKKSSEIDIEFGPWRDPGGLGGTGGVEFGCKKAQLSHLITITDDPVLVVPSLARAYASWLSRPSGCALVHCGSYIGHKESYTIRQPPVPAFAPGNLLGPKYRNRADSGTPPTPAGIVTTPDDGLTSDGVCGMGRHWVPVGPRQYEAYLGSVHGAWADYGWQDIMRRLLATEFEKKHVSMDIDSLTSAQLRIAMIIAMPCRRAEPPGCMHSVTPLRSPSSEDDTMLPHFEIGIADVDVREE
ncbi:hypothetical protein DFH09DRAFT_1474646 [Mycena vulgaris]|nr:hypothetical protein DFH09DRAFT_1474646 [Mycena vulgaris]